MFDFENKGVFFPDVHDNFKFVAFVFGARLRTFATARCAFYLTGLSDLEQVDRVLELKASDFDLVNPNTGAAPVFRDARDARITIGIYERQPVLVRHAAAGAVKAWPVKFAQGKYNMSSDSAQFQTSDELESAGFRRAAANCWQQGDSHRIPLLVGKMIWHFDHRTSGVRVNAANLQVAASAVPASIEQKQDANFHPEPQYWVVPSSDDTELKWVLAFRDITNPTNARTAIASIVPHRLAGNTLPLLLPEAQLPPAEAARQSSLLLATMNSLVFDYVTRQKAKWTHLNWFILEQLPVIQPARFNDPLPAAFATHMRAAGLMNGHHPEPTIADFVVPQVLSLSYTAHDLAPLPAIWVMSMPKVRCCHLSCGTTKTAAPA